MRNELLPTKRAIYQPLPTPFQLSQEKLRASLVESQLEEAQAALEEHTARENIAKELGPIQLLSLRRKLESAPTVGFVRQTTIKFKGGKEELPKPSLTIQGSISKEDVVGFLREQGAFDLETDYSEEGKEVKLNRLTSAQINTACEFALVSAQGDEEAIDKLGRIKKTGRYTLVAHILPSNTRVRIPVLVRPSAASTTSPSPSASLPASTPGQVRTFTSSAKQNSTMEASMRTKLETHFGPQVEVNIRNDSSKHAHHAAMAAQGGGNGETHFYVHVISDKFTGMTQIKRHRAVNALLEEEFGRGLHALSLRTKTWAEERRDPAEAKQQESNVSI